MREKKVRYESEFTIFAFYVNMSTTSWMCLLNKGGRKLEDLQTSERNSQ